MVTCPYSRTEMEPVFDTRLGKTSGWRMRGGADPAVPFLDMESAEAALRMRNGRKSNVKGLKCAYTGAPLSLVELGGLVFVRGDFLSPGRLNPDKQNLIYRASMRNGLPAKGVPESGAAVVVKEYVEPESNPMEGRGDAGVAEEMVAGIVERL